MGVLGGEVGFWAFEWRGGVERRWSCGVVGLGEVLWELSGRFDRWSFGLG